MTGAPIAGSWTGRAGGSAERPHAACTGGTPAHDGRHRPAPMTPAALASFAEADELVVLDAGDAVRSASGAHWTDLLPVDGGRRAGRARAAPRRSAPLAEVMDRRASVLRPGPVPGGSATDLLRDLRTTTDEATDAAGRRWESRVYPSAGGTHSIAFLLHAHDAPGLDPGWYRWSQRGECADPVLLQQSAAVLDAVCGALRAPGRPPAATLAAVADLRLLYGRYPNGTSLAWRDAGVALATAHLLATGLGLTSTLVGASALLAGDHGGATPQVRLLGAVALGAPDPQPWPASVSGATEPAWHRPPQPHPR